MAEIIDMPKLSDTMTVGTLVRWLKNEGDAVAPGDMLAEIETDKATMELENFTKGVLLKQYISMGEQVPVGAALCAIGKPGEAIPQPQPQVKASQPEPQEAVATPIIDVPVSTPERVELGNGRIKASPLAKKMAQAEHLSLAQITGSGPAGRIVKIDILKALEKRHLSAQSQHTGYAPELKAQKIPVSNLRQTIARRLCESKQQNPHFYLSIEINAGPLDQLRQDLNQFYARTSDKPLKLTINDLILRATALALARVPAVNASWQQTTIQQHGSVHLAFGVALEDGLVTPVIRDAQNKSLQQISQEVKSLIDLAKSKKLKPDQMSGSTFTVTNLGMFGITSFYGIVNPPNAGILSVGGIWKAPVVNEKDAIEIGRRMTIGFSGDHRVIDGAVGAQFLGELKSLLETPAPLLI